MHKAAEAQGRLVPDFSVSSADLAAVPLPQRSSLPPLEEGPGEAGAPRIAVLSDIMERPQGAAQPSSACSFVKPSPGASFPASFSVAGAAPLSRGGSRGAGSSLFRQRLASTGNPSASGSVCPHSVGGSNYAEPGTASAAAQNASSSSSSSSLLPTSAQSRLALAQALGFSSVEELDAMDSQAEATVASMSAAELSEAVADAQAALGEGGLASLLSVRNKQHQGGGAAPPTSTRPIFQQQQHPVDLSGISTHEQLLEAAAAYLPPGELKKLEWMGALSPRGELVHEGGVTGVNSSAASPLAEQASSADDLVEQTRLSVRVELKGVEETLERGGRGDFGSGSAQAIALWTAMSELETEEGVGSPSSSVSGTPGGGVAAQQQQHRHALTTDTVATQLSELLQVLGAKGAPSSLQSTAMRAGPGGVGKEVTMAIDPPMKTLRFDLEGYLVRGLGAAGGPGTHDPTALFHHGLDPTKPGYTLFEILGLVRSSVEGQRRLALTMLGGVLRRRRLAFSLAAVEPMSPGGGAIEPAAEALQAQVPWRYPASARCAEMEQYRSLLLPPILPILLRLSLDETGASVLEAALGALLALIAPSVGNGAEEGEADEVGDPVLAFQNMLASPESAMRELLSWGRGRVLPLRPQPPVAHERDCMRRDFPGAAGSAGASPAAAAGGAKAAPGAAPISSTKTASMALEDGAAALSAPGAAYVMRMNTIPRLAYILSTWYLGKRGAGIAPLTSALLALRALVVLLPHVPSTAPVHTVAVPPPGGSPAAAPSTLGLLPWCAHAFLFENAALLRGGAAAAASAPSTPHLLTSSHCALFTLRLIAQRVASSRELARELCDSERGLDGGGSRVPWASALTLDALLQFLPLAGASRAVLEEGKAAWSGAAGSERVLPALDVLALACAWETLGILRACLAYGFGLDRLPTLWQQCLRGLVLAPPHPGGEGGPAQHCKCAAFAALFSAGVLDCLAAFAVAANMEASLNTPLLKAPGLQRRRTPPLGLGVAEGGRAGNGEEEEEEAKEEEEEEVEELREGDVITLGNQAASMLQQCTLSPSATGEGVVCWAQCVGTGGSGVRGWAALLAGRQVALLAAYFCPYPKGPAGGGGAGRASGSVPTSATAPPAADSSSSSSFSSSSTAALPPIEFLPPRTLDEPHATRLLHLAAGLATHFVQPYFAQGSVVMAAAEVAPSSGAAPPSPHLPGTLATLLCSLYRLCTAIALRSPSALGAGLTLTLQTHICATLPHLSASAYARLYPPHAPPAALDATASARDYASSPHLYTRAIRPYLYAAAAAATAACTLGLSPTQLPLQYTASLALALGSPGEDEALAAALMDCTLFAPPPGATGRGLQDFLASRTALQGLFTEGALGWGAAAGGVREDTARSLHAFFPGIIPLGTPAQGPLLLKGFPKHLASCTTASRPLSSGSTSSSPSNKESSSSSSSAAAEHLPFLLALLPPLLRPTMGLPHAHPSASACTAHPLLHLCLAIDVVFSGAGEGLVGERARVGLERARGGVGGSALCYLTHSLTLLLGARGGLVEGLLAPPHTASSSMGTGSSPSLHHACAASLTHALFLLLHMGLMPPCAIEQGAPLSTITEEMLGINALCTQLSLQMLLQPPTQGQLQLQRPPSFTFTPLALLLVHPRCGGGGTLAATSKALGEAMGCEGPHTGASPHSALAALLILSQRPLMALCSTSSAGGSVGGDSAAAALYSAAMGLFLESGKGGASGGGGAQGVAEDPLHPSAPALAALLEEQNTGGGGGSVGLLPTPHGSRPHPAAALGMLAGALLPPPMPTAPRASPLAQAELALVNAALAHLTSASTTAAAEGEAALEGAAQGGGGAAWRDFRLAALAWKVTGPAVTPCPGGQGAICSAPRGPQGKGAVLRAGPWRSASAGGAAGGAANFPLCPCIGYPLWIPVGPGWRVLAQRGGGGGHCSAQPGLSTRLPCH